MLDPTLTTRLYELQDDYGAAAVAKAAARLWPDEDIAAWDDTRRNVAADGFPNTPEGSDDAARSVEAAGRTHETDTGFGIAQVTTEHRTRLYVAGVISGDPRPFEEKRDAFYVGAKILTDRGYDTVNPLDVANDLCFHGPDKCYGETLRRLKGKDQGAGHSWECYLRHDMIELLQCDGVALLPNWHLSPGARAEFDLANTVGIPCKPIEEWLDARQVFVGMDPGTNTTVSGYRDDDSVFHQSGAPIGDASRESTCRLCRCEIRYDGLAWYDNHPDTGRFCAVSKDPDAAHIPTDTGEQR
jgi:hypothetical protein